ncbi:adenine deaminase [Sphaerochaeta sp.]|uniref:adenine deaminase n=1 Tax=Sphaerochaeta sp. TaxID=1972642 RepID=UPI002FC97A63
MTDTEKLRRLVDVAAGRLPADLVIKQCKVVDVYSGVITETDIAVCDGVIAGLGSYSGIEEFDAQGLYAAPGFIDSHIHIESSYVTPEEMGRLVVPYGTTTIIADPHEIVNVCGIPGLSYMLDAANGTALDIRFMIPSCVPATPFEHSGARIDADAMRKPIVDDRILGVGEFMDFPGVVSAQEGALEKLLLARTVGKLVDGHSPGLSGKDLNAYAATLIHTDHECSTVEEMQDRIARGMYVLLREGSACHELSKLLKGITPYNSKRCLLCSDDRQPKTIFEKGHLDEHLRMLVRGGISPIVALQMASLNAAECFHLYDRGAIAPGLKADIVLLEDLEEFKVRSVYISGRCVADKGIYQLPVHRHSIEAVRSSFHVKDFSKQKLELALHSDLVHTIDILPGSVVTAKGQVRVKRDPKGRFLYDPTLDVVKVAVVERHQSTGNVALGLLRGYGIKEGAIAISIAHDSHNIIVVGVDDDDMAYAVETLIEQNGGMVLVKEGSTLAAMPMPVGGIMSDQSGEWVDAKLTELHEVAYRQLHVNSDVEPIMTLCFMSLAVIPEIKLTDMGLFDVTTFSFIPLEV